MPKRSILSAKNFLQFNEIDLRSLEISRWLFATTHTFKTKDIFCFAENRTNIECQRISPEVEELSHDLPDVLVLLEAAVLVEQDHRRGCEGCLQLEELMQALLRGLSHLILRTKTIKVNNSGDPIGKHSII